MRGKQLQQGIVVGFFIVASFWLLSLIWDLAKKAEVAVRESQSAEAEYRALAERRRSLEASLAALNTPRGKDAAIRTAFGVARPGEEVIVVVPPASSTPTTTRSLWQKLLDWF